MVWVLRNSPAKLGARLTLLALADFAHPDGSESYPSVETLSKHTRMSRRSVQSALRLLEDEGHVARDGVGRNGTNCWRVKMGGAESAPRAESDIEGRNLRLEGGEAASPNPSKEPSKEPSKDERASVSADEFPADLPPSMHDVAIQAGVILRRVAQQRGQRKQVTRAAVGQSVVSFPDRDHVQVAHDVEYWLLHGKGRTKSCADIVSRYRQFLKSSDPMAGAPLPQGVTPIRARGGGPSAEDFLRAGGVL